MKVQSQTVFEAMGPDLARVDDRVAAAAEVGYPLASSLVGDLVQAGGKRLRPLVLLLAGRAYHYDLDRLVTAAAGVELLHTASLIHDDIVDRAALRRGKPTLNSQLSTGAVILIGDYLFAQSAVLAAATKDPRVLAIFASTLADICDGQLREMFDAHRLDQNREDYERRIYGKTASLFAGAAEMGAVLAGAPETHVQALREYGRNLGLAFQIIDDVLDLRESPTRLGKPAGQDLRQGTVTLPTMIYAADLGESSYQAGQLSAVITGDVEDEVAIDALVDDVRSSGALAATVRVAESFVDQAKACLSLVPDATVRDLLAELAEFALARAS